MLRTFNVQKLGTVARNSNIRLFSSKAKTTKDNVVYGVDYQFTGPASPHPNYAVWVGLETHAQIISDTKLFSSASTSFQAPPNSCTALFDAAIPGTLPRINTKCVEQAIRMGLAVGGKVNLKSHFDRKHYFYCDMPLGYQITQQDVPVVEGGSISLDSLLPDGHSRSVRIERIQLEQDSGKSLHDVTPDASYVDLNRAGCALLEIVTAPDIRSADEAVAYLRKLQALLRHTGVSTGNLEDGSMRCDVNVTVRRIDPPGKMTGRVEVKNMNSFKFIHRAINYEAQRQIDISEAEGIVERETRNFDPKTGLTSRLRAKEDMLDYRFFPEPDLPFLSISPEFVQKVKSEMPALPDTLFARFTQEFGLPRKAANVLLGEQDAAQYFLDMMTDAKARTPQLCYNWLTTEYFGRLKKNRKEQDGIVGLGDDARQIPLLSGSSISAARLAELVEMVAAGDISGKQGKDILDMMVEGEDARNPRDIAKAKNMLVDNDPVRIQQLCEKIMSVYTDEVETYVTTGKQSMVGFLSGQAIKLSRQQKAADGTPLGEANPKEIGRVMQELLDKAKDKQ